MYMLTCFKELEKEKVAQFTLYIPLETPEIREISHSGVVVQHCGIDVESHHLHIQKALSYKASKLVDLRVFLDIISLAGETCGPSSGPTSASMDHFHGPYAPS